jgi:lipoprotein-anchoring transpeptidase ErfK/SrfK
LKKNKILTFIILFVLIIAGLFITYKFNFLNMKTKETIKEVSQNTIDNKQESKKENEEIIVVILNKKPKQESNQETIEKQETIEEVETEQANSNEIQTTTEQEDKTLETNKVTETREEVVASQYYIKVNYEANVVTIYSEDENGNYTIPYKAMTCSTGTATPTSGTYKIDYKYRWLGLLGGVYGQYCTRIVGNILFHSVPYLTNGNNGSLEYWEYDKLGTTASAGCVRLTVADAKWIYDNCGSGTYVEFYADENSGPLGKPETKKISEYEEYRNWDPTDLNEDNPWANFV